MFRTREQICSNLITLIKSDKNVTYRFLNDEPITRDLTPIEFDDITIEISVKIPRMSAEEKLKSEAVGKLKSSARLEECILYEEVDIIKQPYFNQVLSIIRQFNSDVEPDELLYLPKTREVHPLFGKHGNVTKSADPFFMQLIFEIKYGHFMNDKEGYTAILKEIIGNTGNNENTENKNKANISPEIPKFRSITEFDYINEGIKQWKIDMYASNSHLIKIPLERERIKKEELRKKYNDLHKDS